MSLDYFSRWGRALTRWDLPGGLLRTPSLILLTLIAAGCTSESPIASPASTAGVPPQAASTKQLPTALVASTKRLPTTVAAIPGPNESRTPPSPQSPTLPITQRPSPTPIPRPVVSPTGDPSPTLILNPTTPLTQLTVTIADAQSAVGEDFPVQVTMYVAKSGLSGFDIVITIEDPSIAEIIGAEFPEYGLTEVSMVSENRIRLRAIDVEDIVPLQVQEWVLSTLILRGKSRGSTTIGLEIFGMDDDSGTLMTPLVVKGALTVE